MNYFLRLLPALVALLTLPLAAAAQSREQMQQATHPTSLPTRWVAPVAKTKVGYREQSAKHESGGESRLSRPTI